MNAAVPDAAPDHDARDAPALAALVAAARAGNREAFGQLVALNQRAVYRAALAALGRPEDAEDVAQEAFVLAWRKLAGFRGDASFRTWLLTITWRKALDRRRARGARWQRHADGPSADRHPLDDVAADGPDPERAAVAADLAARARAAIQDLTPRLRDTLLLAASGQYAYGEIATMLDIPIGTVKWRVAEARRLVRVRLTEAHDGR